MINITGNQALDFYIMQTEMEASASLEEKLIKKKEELESKGYSPLEVDDELSAYLDWLVGGDGHSLEDLPDEELKSIRYLFL